MIALRQFAAIVFVGGVTLLAGTAHAASLALFNTGAGLADGATDSHWTLGSNPGAYGSTLTVASNGAYPLNGSWVANDSTSKWLVPGGTQTTHTSSSTVFYDYTTSFSMAGFNPSTGSLNFQFAVDNVLEDVLFNGVSLKSAPYGMSFTGVSYTGFSNIYNVTSGFVAGTNTLVFRVSNTPPDTTQNPVGLNVRISGSATVVPEGNSAILIGAALPFLGAVVLRRRK